MTVNDLVLIACLFMGRGQDCARELTDCANSKSYAYMEELKKETCKKKPKKDEVCVIDPKPMWSDYVLECAAARGKK